MSAEHLVHVGSDNWHSEVLGASVPVLVDFWAPWCAPCLAIAPTLEELSVELAGKLKIAKLNVDDNRQLASDFGIRSIPNLLFFRGGAVQAQMVGAVGKAALKDKLLKLL
jgi:thioredoxin 1